MTHDLNVLKQVRQKRLDDATLARSRARLELERQVQAVQEAEAAWRTSVAVELEKKQALFQLARQGLSRRELDYLRWDLDKSRNLVFEKQQRVSETERYKKSAEQAVLEARLEYQKKSAALEKIKMVHSQKVLVMKRKRDAQEDSRMEENFLARRVINMT
jgi:hypothetical protein